MDQIPYHEIKFHPHSFGDPDGRLFWWDGQLYRGISHEKTPFFRQLFQNGIIQELIDRGLLIGSEPTDLALDGYGMVVRHCRVPFVSYPHEWCAAMFKDGALAYVDLVRELVLRGLTLKDTHPWNLLFEGCKPVYVDLTSIRALTDDSPYLSYDKFCHYYLYPLILMSQGQERIARYLLPDYEGILQSDLLILTRRPVPLASASSMIRRLTSALQQRVPEPYRGLLKNTLKSIQSLIRIQSNDLNSQLDSLERIGQEIEEVASPVSGAKWPDYDMNSIPFASTQDGWAVKQQTLHKIIAELHPESILAIGSNMTGYSKLAAHLGSKVVTFDKDSKCITQLYYDARDKELPILPLIMDFTDPTPSRGLSSHLSIAATERLQCDLVLALALVNQVIFERHLRFNQVVDGLAQFSKRWLIVDFIPRGARDMCASPSDRFSGYTVENFIHTLKKRFRNVSIVLSDPEGRVLLLCEK